MPATLDAPSPALIAALAGAAFVAGLVDAIGGGGGLVSMPALLAAGLPPAIAIGTNKGQAIFGRGVVVPVVLAQRRDRPRAARRSASWPGSPARCWARARWSRCGPSRCGRW